MNTLPKLNIEGLSQLDVKGLVSPVTPATAEKETASGENNLRNKRRRVGGLPIRALVNEKNDESPAPYPWEYQVSVGAEVVTPARPEVPSILYQMSEFVVQLEERAAQGNLPVVRSLGLQTNEGPAAQRVSMGGYPSRGQEPIPHGNEAPKRNILPPLKFLKVAFTEREVQGRLQDSSRPHARGSTAKSKNNEAPEHDNIPASKVLGGPTIEQVATEEDSSKSADGFRLRLRAASLKESYASGHDEVVALDKGDTSPRTECQEKPRASRRKRTRAERDIPITTKPEIETIIKRLRDREQNTVEEESEGQKGTPALVKTDGGGEARSPTRPAAHVLRPGVSKGSKIAKPSKQRRGRPNGDNRPRPHACPTCQLRFHQQSGVVNHYRVVHLREKRFECPHKCGLKFGARGDVTRHVDAVHKKLRNFECQVCGDAFARKSILTRHCKNIHSDVFGADESHDCVHGCADKPRSKREG